MGILRFCRLLRNVCAAVVIAGMISDFQPAISWGLAVYFMTLAVSQLTIEGFFMSAYEEGLNEQKSDRAVGGSDVPQAGPRG